MVSVSRKELMVGGGGVGVGVGGVGGGGVSNINGKGVQEVSIGH